MCSIDAAILLSYIVKDITHNIILIRFLANKMIVFGGMNNSNYLGSSLFIIHLEFNSRPAKQTEEEKAVELMTRNLQLLGPDGMKKLERMKKRRLDESCLL